MTLPAAEPHTAATAAALTAASLHVGRGAKPAGSGWQGEPGASDFVPYVVLYPGGHLDDGVLGDPWEDLDYRVQATCVAGTCEGAELVADIVTATLIGKVVPVPGRGMYPFQLSGGAPASRDDQVEPPVHYAVLNLMARSGPA
jgi:hypothetical protein